MCGNYREITFRHNKSFVTKYHKLISFLIEQQQRIDLHKAILNSSEKHSVNCSRRSIATLKYHNLKFRKSQIKTQQKKTYLNAM